MNAYPNAQRQRPIRGKDTRKVGLFKLECPFELIEARRQRPPEKLHIRLRHRPVDLHDLPLVAFEMQNIGCPRVKGRPRRGDRLLAARPADGSFFPRLDLVRDDRKAADFLDLTLPDRACLIPVPPLARIVSDDQGAFMFRQALESRLMIPCGSRPREPLDDPADLLRRLHAASLAKRTALRNRAEAQPQTRGTATSALRVCRNVP